MASSDVDAIGAAAGAWERGLMEKLGEGDRCCGTFRLMVVELKLGFMSKIKGVISKSNI